MVKVTTTYGKVIEIDCIGCAFARGEIESTGGLLYNGTGFEARCDLEIPVRGFFVIGSKRHIVGPAEFTGKEMEEFSKLLVKLRKAMQDILGIKRVTYLCRESTIDSSVNPSHFHLGLLPEYPWMKAKGTEEIFNYAKNLKNLNEVEEAAKEIKVYLNK
ncbi:MAG: hypothetical protein ABIG95_06030 [Candidatus Woesearchaeota archaeon]